ncbi:MAG: hypothetical protein ABIN80_00715 [Dyadobacter sp.]|uniref:hypothetical protein n=1 Tax=Dyadobacter sp. TaxID=1914288 RepID=UPI0032672496
MLVINDLTFTMVYTAGSSPTLDYKMPFSLTDTSEITYDFENASFNFKDDPETIVTEADFNVQKTVDQRKEQDLYELKKPIVLRRDQELIVKQRFIARYENFNGVLNDIYYVNQHTMNVSVEFKYKGAFTINIHPTFQHSIKPKQSRFNNEITYSAIPFLVPGQGYMFSIKKTVEK